MDSCNHENTANIIPNAEINNQKERRCARLSADISVIESPQIISKPSSVVDEDKNWFIPDTTSENAIADSPSGSAIIR